MQLPPTHIMDLLQGGVPGVAIGGAQNQNITAWWCSSVRSGDDFVHIDVAIFQFLSQATAVWGGVL